MSFWLEERVYLVLLRLFKHSKYPSQDLQFFHSQLIFYKKPSSTEDYAEPENVSYLSNLFPTE